MSPGARRALIVAVAAAVLVGGGYAYSAYREAEAAEQERADRQARERREQREEAEAIERITRLQEESLRLIPELIRPVALGQTRQEVRRHRPAAQPNLENSDQTKIWLEERFPNGAQALYGFDRRVNRLVQIQILSLLPDTSAIAPHLTAMNEQYGRPTGIWDCPDTGGVPTRRFTWRHSETTIMDVFLIYRGRVSVTLYIAPSSTIGASLQRAHCRPAAPDQIATFPITSEEQMTASQQGAGKAPAKNQPVLRAPR